MKKLLFILILVGSMINISSAEYINGGYITDRSITYGIPTYIKWDNTIQPISNLNINNGNYPYLFYTGTNNYVFTTGNTVLYIPKEHTNIKTYPHKISPELVYSKEVLFNNMINYNDTIAYLVFPYSLNRVIDYIDEHNINVGKFNFIADNTHILIKDSYDTVLNDSYYDFRINTNNNEIRLYFNKQEANKLNGDISFTLNSWMLGNTFQSWGNNVSLVNTTVNKELSQIELDLNVSDYISYYRFDNPAYTTFCLDDGEFNNTGTGEISKTVGIQEYAGVFNESQQMSLLNNYDSLNFTNTSQFSICAWAYSNDTASAFHTIVSNVPAGSKFHYDIMRYSDDITSNAWSTTQTSVTNLNNISANSWFHVTAKGTRNSLGYTYINGTSKVGTYGNTAISGSAVRIGASFSPSYFWDGYIDEVLFYNRTLSSKEINDVMNLNKSAVGTVNITYDAGIGYHTDRIKANWTIDSNTNYSINVYNNDTLVFIEQIANHATDTFFTSAITSPTQDTLLNIIFYGNISKTPDLLNVTFYKNISSCNDSQPCPPININVDSKTISTINWSFQANNTPPCNLTDIFYKWFNQVSWENNTNAYYNATGLNCNTAYNLTVWTGNTSCNGTISDTYLYNSTNTSLCTPTPTPTAIPLGDSYIILVDPYNNVSYKLEDENYTLKGIYYNNQLIPLNNSSSIYQITGIKESEFSIEYLTTIFLSMFSFIIFVALMYYGVTGGRRR